MKNFLYNLFYNKTISFKYIEPDLLPPLKKCPWCLSLPDIDRMYDLYRCKKHTVWMNRDEWNNQKYQKETEND